MMLLKALARALSRMPEQTLLPRKKRRERGSSRVFAQLKSRNRSARLSPDRVTNGVQYIDEAARRAHIAEQRHSREHLQFAIRHGVDAPHLFVLLEFFPRGF